MLNTAVQEFALPWNPISIFLLSVDLDTYFFLNPNFWVMLQWQKRHGWVSCWAQQFLGKNLVKSLRDISVSKLWELLLMNWQNMRTVTKSALWHLYLALIPLQIYLTLQSLPKHFSINKIRKLLTQNTWFYTASQRLFCLSLCECYLVLEDFSLVAWNRKTF